jgi:hypothetical protein
MLRVVIYLAVAGKAGFIGDDIAIGLAGNFYVVGLGYALARGNVSVVLGSISGLVLYQFRDFAYWVPGICRGSHQAHNQKANGACACKQVNFLHSSLLNSRAGSRHTRLGVRFVMAAVYSQIIYKSILLCL